MGDACCGPETPGHATDDQEPQRWWQARELQAAIISGAALVAALVAGWTGAADAVVLALEVVALGVGAWTFVPSTLRRLTHGLVGVGTLMTVAATGAVILGEVGEAAMLAFLFSISEGLEEYSLTRTRRGLRALLSLVPEQATVVRDGTQTVVAVEQLQAGDRMVIRPGERVATDGMIETGRSTLDVSAITGESVPIETGPGAVVYAGSINGSGVLEVTVTAGTEDNSLARIVNIVEAEQARKGASQRLADRIAQPLVPGIIIAAAAIAVIGSLAGDPVLWIERALVVLVAASPCALAISVPVTVVAAIGAASKHGVLIKGGAALEALGTIRTVALDKTGTLTANQPTVVDIATTNGATADHVMQTAAALEVRSEHPLAAAILAVVDDVQPADSVQAVPGAGLTGTLNDRTVRLGRPGWINPDGLTDTVQRLQQAGQQWCSSRMTEGCSGRSRCVTNCGPKPRKWSVSCTAAGFRWRCSPVTTGPPPPPSLPKRASTSCMPS